MIILPFLTNKLNKYNMNDDIYAKYEEGVEKWYFVGTVEYPDRIAWTTTILNTGKSPYGTINYLSPPYKTRELLEKHQNILKDPCVECGGVVMANYIGNKQMIERNMCFSCNHWTNAIESTKRDNIMIVNSTVYTVVEDKPNTPNSFKGFGGAKFVFLKDGNTITSTNVWCGGDIPKHFRERIPDNAKIIK